MSDSDAVTYRFGLRDRTGWILGLSAVQCLVLGAGILGAGVLLNTGAPGVAVLVPLAVGAAVAFGTWAGQPLHQVGPVAIAWVVVRATGRHWWRAPLPRWRLDGRPVRTQHALPPCLEGITLTSWEGDPSVGGRPNSVAVIRDRVERMSSVVLRVSGRDFALAERSEQQHQLARWGDALAGFCVERGPVARFRWIEWTGPTILDDHLAYLDHRQSGATGSGPVSAYHHLLDEAEATASRHEVLLVVTVADARLRHRRAEEAAVEEARLLASRLQNAGLHVDAPLTEGEVAAMFRHRLDPHQHLTAGPQRGKRSLTQLARLVAAASAGPLSVEAGFTSVRVDRTWHAAYVIAEWPRLDVGPNWMEPLILHAGGVRSIAVHHEPVAPSRSARQIDRDTIRLATEEEERHRQGFRIGGRHRRAQSELAEREAELVAGYPELEFVGTVHIAAPDLDTLDRSCVEYEHVAAQAGIELRRLDGQHDLALACMLPIGRGIAGKRGMP